MDMLKDFNFEIDSKTNKVTVNALEVSRKDLHLLMRTIFKMYDEIVEFEKYLETDDLFKKVVNILNIGEDVENVKIKEKNSFRVRRI
jgi:hypothetical protein